MSEGTDVPPQFSRRIYQRKQFLTGLAMVAVAAGIVLVPTLLVIVFTDLSGVLALLGGVGATVLLLVLVVLVVGRMRPPMM